MNGFQARHLKRGWGRSGVFRLQHRKRAAPPGFDHVYQQARSDPEFKPACFSAGAYWCIAGLWMWFTARQREDDSFNSPVIWGGPGYYHARTFNQFIDEKPDHLDVDEMSNDYTKWRYKHALERKVKPVLKVFMKNIKYFENWDHDIEIGILGSGFCFDLDLEFLASYVGDSGRIYLFDKNIEPTQQALQQVFGDNIPKQFVLVETDVSRTTLNENMADLDAQIESLQPGEKLVDPPFPAPFEKRCDIVLSALVLSQMRMMKQHEGKEVPLTESHLRLLDRLRKEEGHTLIHDDAMLTTIFKVRDRILNGLEKMNLDAHLKYDWPPDNICQFPSVNDHILQTFMVHVRGRQSAI